MLYEEGMIPTYSFPKNVVSTYITDSNGRSLYEVDRGLDVAISEYAPGRAIVVDKSTYQIGGFYYPGSERKHGRFQSPAKAFVDDANYLKPVLICNDCGWFGLADEQMEKCPFCGSQQIAQDRRMLRPWGFAPKDGKAISDVQLEEEYSSTQQPLYSTLPDQDEMNTIHGFEHVRMASRTNQRIIMMNRGPQNNGFMVCRECGAAMPGNTEDVLKDVYRPYKSHLPLARCRHHDTVNVNLGYDFVTDMLVLEFQLDKNKMDVRQKESQWLNRAAQSLAEAMRLAVSKELDIEFTELVTGYRIRTNTHGEFVDVYLYDSLSSGAGYAVSVAQNIAVLLERVESLLKDCHCGSACHQCLKHYRNQFIHGQLDRFAALELLRWGKNGAMAAPVSPKQQNRYLETLKSILQQNEIIIEGTCDCALAKCGGKEKKIVVYPAMWREPKKSGVIYVSDAYMKYAKPYAVQKIIEEIKNDFSL